MNGIEIKTAIQAIAKTFNEETKKEELPTVEFNCPFCKQTFITAHYAVNPARDTGPTHFAICRRCGWLCGTRES